MGSIRNSNSSCLTYTTALINLIWSNSYQRAAQPVSVYTQETDEAHQPEPSAFESPRPEVLEQLTWSWAPTSFSEGLSSTSRFPLKAAAGDGLGSPRAARARGQNSPWGSACIKNHINVLVWTTHLVSFSLRLI